MNTYFRGFKWSSYFMEIPTNQPFPKPATSDDRNKTNSLQHC